MDDLERPIPPFNDLWSQMTLSQRIHAHRELIAEAERRLAGTGNPKAIRAAAKKMANAALARARRNG